MTDLWKTLAFICTGERTKRFHTKDTIKTNTVAEHSFSVIWLIHQLTKGKASNNLIMAGASHDLAEHVTGDMPGHTKRALGELGARLTELEESLLLDHDMFFPISNEEQRILSMADYMSGMLFCCIERSLGNKTLDKVYATWHSYVMQLTPTGVELTILEFIQSRWQEAIK